MIRTSKRIWLCSFMIVAILVFIWGNSLMPAKVSQAISDFVAWLLLGTQSVNGEMAEGSGVLRKIAHFTEFMSLGMCLFWLFSMLGKRKAMALLCGAAAACTDETIQLFVPDRGPSLKDVGIDTCGVITGMILLQIGYRLWKRKQTTNYGGNNQ